MTYRILDLFCGAGGAAMGYADAGFEVVGVDIEPQPRYPFRFYQADAMRFWTDWGYYFDAIHASPPCQRYSAISRCAPGLAEQYPDLVGPVRELLIETGLPYVIENVPGAPLEGVTLCGSMFDRYTTWQGVTYGLRRHREFETSFAVAQPPCRHRKGVLSIGVYGNGAGGGRPRSVKGPGFEQARRDVMGIDWMTREELNESIPPAYTEHIGRHLIAYLDSTSNREAA